MIDWQPPSFQSESCPSYVLPLRMFCMKPAIMVALDILTNQKYQLDANQVLEAPRAMTIRRLNSLTPTNIAENIADNACQI
jgi:hypothetical protein